MATTASHIWRPSASRLLLLDGFIPGPRGFATDPAIPLRWPAKDPGDVLDYQLDISPALAGNDGDNIATIDALITPSNDGDLLLVSSGADGPRAVFWFQGGFSGVVYNVTIMIGTETGRMISRSVLLPVVTFALQAANNLPLTTEGGTALVDSDGNALILGSGNV